MTALTHVLPDGCGVAEMPNPGARLKSAVRYADASARQPAWHCACEVCQTSSGSAPAYFARAFGEPQQFPATSEDVADSLGFCARHGADLMADSSLRWGVAQVFQGVVPRVLPFLAEQRFGESRFQQVYFWAHDACPACAYERRVAGRHAGLLGRHHDAVCAPGGGPGTPPSLCIAHFQVLARGLRPEQRMPALASYAQRLDHVAGAVEALTAAGIPRNAVTSELPALEQALRVIGGLSERTVAPEPPAPLAEALRACSGFEQALAWTHACPVCVEAERARQRWLAVMPLAASYHLDDWLFLPTCPEHVATLARLGDATLTTAGAAHALHVATASVNQQLRVLVRAAETESERAAARIVHWGHRPRRHKKPGMPKSPTLRVARCAACERVAIAEMHATGVLLRLLQSGKYRNAFESGYGLCMKHHAQAYLLAPKGQVRDVLAADQSRRLSGSLHWFEREARSSAPGGCVTTPGDESQMALRRFCGFG